MAEGDNKIVYRGGAVIVNIDGTEMTEKAKAKLPKSDVDNGICINLVFVCAEGDGGEGAKTHDVEVEFSHRELTGRMLELYKREDEKTPTQMDVFLASMKKAGIVARDRTLGGDTPEENAALCDEVMSACTGKRVNISVTQRPKNDGTGDYWPERGYFQGGAAKLSGSALRDRIAAMRNGGKVTKTSTPQGGARQATAPAPAAPVDDGADDMPF